MKTNGKNCRTSVCSGRGRTAVFQGIPEKKTQNGAKNDANQMFCKKKVGTFLAVAAAGVLSIAIAVPAVASSDAVKGIYAFSAMKNITQKVP